MHGVSEYMASGYRGTPEEVAERDKEFEALTQKLREARQKKEEDEQAAIDAANVKQWAENWARRKKAGNKGAGENTLAQMRACLESM